ncbi:Signal transduction histidine kinase [Loktanella fryxellensis]|uniref:histidine kinase n=1 Tax=Loktanella fryxellensis TaxID=245187 RepID=A0A1H7Z7V2_9RHOB|nr:HAMP domain-containing sensor histidine kinase [Loktanella fryxellensis]SEM54500.1 Signal transduction histidine kinase [Loktanella fryxellensis]
MSRLFTLLRASPVRLALGLVALFALVSLASLAASYAASRASLDATMRSDLTQDIAGFRAAPNARALAALVAAEARVTDPARVVLSYVTATGQRFGNGRLAQDRDGYFLTTLDAPDRRIDGQYLALTTPLYGGQLTIARSRAEIDALFTVFRNIVLLSLLPTLAVALGAALMLARRSARQVAALGRTLDRLTTGDLAARVHPTARWSDDFHRIATRIDRMAAAQEASVDSLRQVSSDVAHDLKTPIQRISVHLDQLSDMALPPDATTLVDRARAEVDGVVSVFHALLQIAQIEAGTRKSRFAPVDLVPLVATFAELYDPAAAEAGRDLRLCVATKAAVVQGDRDLLGQILANLIENALRHTPDGTPITIGLSEVDGTIVLTVTDAGPGIPEHERDKVLQRLYRLDCSRATPGSGLGLALVAVIADLHDAVLTLQDASPGLQVALRFKPVR